MDTMAEIIYVVIGTMGEYAEWPVAAYTNKEEAKKHLKLAKKRASEIQIEMYEARPFQYWDIPIKNDYDKNMKIDNTGTSYFIYEVELFVDIFQYKLEI